MFQIDNHQKKSLKGGQLLLLETMSRFCQREHNRERHDSQIRCHPMDEKPKEIWLIRNLMWLITMLTLRKYFMLSALRPVPPIQALLQLLFRNKYTPKHLAEANWWLLSALCSCVKEAAYLQRLLQESFKQHTQLSLVQGLSFDNYNPKKYYQEWNSNFMLSVVTYCCSSNYHNMATCTTAGYESATRIQEIFS